MSDKTLPPDLAARVAAFQTAMGLKPTGGGAAAPAAAAGDGDAAPAAAAGDADGSDMASRVAAIKARMQAGGGGAAAKPAPTSGATDVSSRVAELKAKMATGKGAAGAGPRKPIGRPSGKNIWPVQPVDRTSFGQEDLYQPNTLNKWFVLCGLLLTVMTLLMWQRDHVRDWKHWQRLKQQNDIEKLEAEVAAAEGAVDSETLERIEAELAEAEAALAAQQSRLEELQADVLALDGEAYKTNQAYQFTKSVFDARRYEFEQLRIAEGGDPDALDESEAALKTLRAELDAYKLAADLAAEALQSRKVEMERLRANLTAATRSRDDLLADVTLLRGRLEKLDPSNPVVGFFNRHLRDAPLLDMLQPTLKIDQIVLEKLTDNYNFMHVGRIDRCTTCHVAIDNVAYIDHDVDNSEGERVLNAHPRLDLFVSDGSPHPKKEFGCTVCHAGRGQAVEFPRTFHTPAADEWETVEEKTERWVADFGYQPDRHYWDWPMIPADKSYASCFQCHQDTARLEGADDYNHSRALVEDLGCYGCHKIQGLEGLRKTGPDLTHITAKTTEDWIAKWILDPKGFRPSTRMPHFWDQSNRGATPEQLDEIGYESDIPWHNNSDSFVDDYQLRNEVEARAITAYVLQRSDEAGDFDMLPAPNRAGDPDVGADLFEKRGCLACHSLESAGFDKSWHGPELSAVGSKTNPQWLYNWLLDPRKYYPTTVMPDLRLTEDEAWDITAYLMQQQHEDWDDVPEPRLDQEILDGIAVEYLASLSSETLARQQLADMRAQGGQAAVERYVGGKLFNHYGCAGCHLVPGHYDDKGIGTELTMEGIKEVAKLDFGFEYSHENPKAIPHTRRAFFENKLRDPRVFDRMPVIEGHGEDAEILRYDMKVKQPVDKLKMPNYYLTEDEVQLVTQFVMGLREDGIDPTMKPQFTAEEAVTEHAEQLMEQYNCVGCHRLGARPSRVPFSMELAEQGSEYDLWLARHIEVDGKVLYEEDAWLTDEVYDPWEDEFYDADEYFEELHPLGGPLYVKGYDEGTLGQYIDDKALRPPTLRKEGDKVHAEWLFGFMREPFTVRNHLEARMPDFGFTPEQAQAITQWFSIESDEPWPFRAQELTFDREVLNRGAALFDKYQCQSCHPQGDVMPANPDKLNWGPDLSLAKERLEPEWMAEWLRDPQTISPGTKMPGFFGYTDGVFQWTMPEEQAKAEIEALVHYLVFMDRYVPPPEVSQADDAGDTGPADEPR